MACSWPKAFSIASVNTDSRATPKSLGRMAIGQVGSLVAIDNTAAAVDREVGVPRSEMKRLVARVNKKGPSQVRRSPSWADTITLAGELSLLARRAARRKKPIVTAAAEPEAR